METGAGYLRLEDACREMIEAQVSLKVRVGYAA
jgi:hypothetical protein